jgi:bacillithiol system protein YtxJ
MNNKWKALNSIEQLDAIILDSNNNPSVIFKHSTRCSISTMALNRLEKLDSTFYDKVHFYYLDLIAYREVSNAIAEKLSVHHESPQVVWVENEECTYDASHMEINCNELVEQLK